MEAQGIADLLVDGVWYAFAAGSMFGTFCLGPLVIAAWDHYCDWKESRARWQSWVS